MEMVDVDGDRTTIDFHAIELNTGLKAGDFELTLPAGTRIVRPLDANGKDSR
jgi:outer membrane lipoprotein-sorting protein